MRNSARLLLVMTLGIAACRQWPDSYPPPEQRQPIESSRPYQISKVVDMADGDAPAHIVQDIALGTEGSWRWCGQKPTVKVKVRSNQGLRYTIDFAIAEATFKETGPVTVSFWVGDHLVDRVKYDAPGNKHFEKPVPAGWVPEGRDVTVAAEIDKVWVSQKDGARLGFILTRMGLTQ